MQLTRMFTTEKYKGSRNYLNSQKKYEVMRTVLYFAIALSLFIAGYLATKSRMNLLTIVAVLGCLPASKSAVGMIMFLRFNSCSAENADKIDPHMENLTGLYDMVFTAYDKNYRIAHITVKGNTICGFTEDPSYDEQAFYKHIGDILKVENFRDTSIKVFSDIQKYTNRLEQIKELDAAEGNTDGIINTLKSVAL